jgi:hypothetical protein
VEGYLLLWSLNHGEMVGLRFESGYYTLVVVAYHYHQLPRKREIERTENRGLQRLVGVEAIYQRTQNTVDLQSNRFSGIHSNGMS